MNSKMARMNIILFLGQEKINIRKKKLIDQGWAFECNSRYIEKHQTAYFVYTTNVMLSAAFIFISEFLYSYMIMKIILAMICVLVIEWPNEKSGNLL